VPEECREDRHALRSQLAWAGFGPLQNALWIFPAPGDVEGALARLGLLEYVKIFRAEAVAPGDPRLLAATAWDLTRLAGGYLEFLGRWERSADGALDDLAGQVRLEAEWLLLAREDPRLPPALLPKDWPGLRAEQVFRSERERLDGPARRLAGTSLDWLPEPKRS
jgi:phenylacetic acid degradation operon negative regulatory protein